MKYDSLGLTHGQTVPYDRRVIKNAWMTNVFRRTLAFADLGVLEISAIEGNAHQHGVVMVVAESKADNIGLTRAEAFECEATESQKSILASLAKIEGNIPNGLEKRARSELPVLFIAEFAVVSSAVYFRDGIRKMVYENIYEKLLGQSDPQLNETNNNLKDVSGCDINKPQGVSKNLSLIDVNTPQFVVAAARHALQG